MKFWRTFHNGRKISFQPIVIRLFISANYFFFRAVIIGTTSWSHEKLDSSQHLSFAHLSCGALLLVSKSNTSFLFRWTMRWVTNDVHYLWERDRNFRSARFESPNFRATYFIAFNFRRAFSSKGVCVNLG